MFSNSLSGDGSASQQAHFITTYANDISKEAASDVLRPVIIATIIDFWLILHILSPTFATLYYETFVKLDVFITVR
ncbi:MAG TPA: hypothetical protein VEL70_01390 [Candidatus Acidoferrum sp.]|nr:hypothetical protein [Candidatus Acidoferrum sp.]